MKDRELDELVAEKVLKLRHWDTWRDQARTMPVREWYMPGARHSTSDLPHFSTSIADAWLVVEEMRRRGWDFILEVVHDKSRIHPNAGIFDAQFSSRDGEGQAYTDDTPARAICLAALRALGVEVTT